MIQLSVQGGIESIWVVCVFVLLAVASVIGASMSICVRQAWRAVWFVCAMVVVLSWHSRLVEAATISVRFDQDVYVVQGPGEAIDAWVLIDGDLSSEAIEPLRAGLFSMGVKLAYPVAKASLASNADVAVTPELAHFGFQTGPFVEVEPGMAAAKGNIDVNVDPQVPYVGGSLVKFTLTNLASGPDAYPLSLDFFRTVGPNEQLFLDGLGNSLDAEIQFGSARVVVVPEPFGLSLAWIAATVALYRRRQRRLTCYGHG